jgi:hypothetical protein
MKDFGYVTIKQGHAGVSFLAIVCQVLSRELKQMLFVKFNGWPLKEPNKIIAIIVLMMIILMIGICLLNLATCHHTEVPWIL